LPRRVHASSLAAVAADLHCLARRKGLRSALRTVAQGISGTVSARDEMHVLLKELDAVAAPGSEPRLQLDEMTGASLPALAGLNRARCARRADARLAANLAHGWHGFLAHEDGRAVGWYWWLDATAERHPHLDRLGIELGRGDVYGFDFFLDEAHRGEGRALEFLDHVETALRRRGFTRLWGYVDGANTPARWTYSVRGYAMVRTVHLRRGSMRARRAGSGARGSGPRARPTPRGTRRA
jgi:GNAT superfamily N-acetyltransferase